MIQPYSMAEIPVRAEKALPFEPLVLNAKP
jgi:hypothetical protein